LRGGESDQPTPLAREGDGINLVEVNRAIGQLRLEGLNTALKTQMRQTQAEPMAFLLVEIVHATPDGARKESLESLTTGLLLCLIEDFDTDQR
jgi:hypothetical protein